MAEANNARNITRIVVIATILLFLLLAAAFLTQCGSTNDEDQLGTEEAAARMVTPPAIRA